MIKHTTGNTLDELRTEKKERVSVAASWKDRFHCIDCPDREVVDSRGHKSFVCTVELYMVHDLIWDEANLPKRSYCHLACLEKRLGRALVVEDFTNAPINDALKFGYRMPRST